MVCGGVHRRDASGNMKDGLAAPWFNKESPQLYGWLRDTYMGHQVGQAPDPGLAWPGLAGCVRTAG
jgi:hypothetical protein